MQVWTIQFSLYEFLKQILFFPEFWLFLSILFFIAELFTGTFILLSVGIASFCLFVFLLIIQKLWQTSELNHLTILFIFVFLSGFFVYIFMKSNKKIPDINDQ